MKRADIIIKNAQTIISQRKAEEKNIENNCIIQNERKAAEENKQSTMEYDVITPVTETLLDDSEQTIDIGSLNLS